MTELSKKEHHAQMQSMKAFDESMPCIGIFWYDPTDHSFFGVRKSELTPKMGKRQQRKDFLLSTILTFTVKSGQKNISAPKP